MIPCSSPWAGSLIPKTLGIDGPVISASIIPTLYRYYKESFAVKILDEDGNTKTYRARIYNDDGTYSHTEKKDLYFKHKSRIYAKEIKIEKDGKRNVKVVIYQKQMVYYSSKYAEKQKRDRQIVIDKANDLIKSPTKYNRSTSYGDNDKIQEEEKYDGYYSIVSSEKNMTDHELREAYKTLSRIEQSFRIIKTELKARPVFV